MKVFLVLSALLFMTPPTRVNSNQVLGRWMSEGKDLEVEVFKVNDHFAARIVWFECDETSPRPMAAHRDLKNPDPSKRKRSWLDMIVVNDLKFDAQENEWNGGNIYDPNSGHTFKSVARMVSPQEMVVRGYWGFEFLGKSLHFTRVGQGER